LTKALVVAGPRLDDDGVAAVRRFADQTNLGVLNTWGLKGLFPWDSPFHLGTAGLQERDFELAGVLDADVVLGVGLDHDESPPALLGNLTEVEVADLDGWAERLGRAPSGPARPPLYTELAAALQPLYASDAVPLTPARAVATIAAGRPDGAVVAADPGPAGFWVARTFTTTELRSVRVPARRGARWFDVEGARIAVTVAPVDHEPVGDCVLVVWGVGDVASVEEHGAQLAAALAAGGPQVVEVPVELSLTKVLVAVAGPIRAWT
jgi:thiamine pyrophosphate-dependent acetolactate synthase large subunit-like protein